MPYRRITTTVGAADDQERVTVTDSVTTLTAAKAARADRIFVTAETADMRFYYHGGDPSASAGHLIGDGDTLTLYGTENIKNFKAIRTGGTSGHLEVTFEV